MLSREGGKVLKFVAAIWISGLVMVTGENELSLMSNPSGKEQSRFGTVICMDAEGHRVMLGADMQDNFRGGAYVVDLRDQHFKNPHHNLSWSFILPEDAISKPGAGDGPAYMRLMEKGSSFGFDCAMTADGSALAISAPGSNESRGALYFYQWEDGNYREVSKYRPPEIRKGDGFGHRLAASTDGTVVIVSAKARNINQGEAFILQCGPHFKECSVKANLTCPDYVSSKSPSGARIRASFGTSIAMNADGTRAVVGATGFQNEQGIAYVFEDRDGSWELVERLVSSDPRDYGFFGYKVTMDARGETIVVGADGELNYSGAAYLFHRTDRGLWKHEKAFLPTKRVEEDNFGGSLSIAADGKTLLIGAPGMSVNGKTDAGRVYVYQRVSDNWILQRTLAAPEPEANSFFGWAVAVNAEAETIVISAPLSEKETGKFFVGTHTPDSKRDPSSDSLAGDDVISMDHDEL